MKFAATAASVLVFAFAVVGVPTAGQKSMNAMAAIYGSQGGGINYGFSSGQTRFTGGDVIRALGLYQFIGNLYLQPVIGVNEVNQGELIHFKVYALSIIDTDTRTGRPGPASLGLKHYAPTFHIKGGALYQLNNETSVLYANVVNVTETHGSHIVPKLQLFLEEKRRGIGGRWQWHDTTLHFEQGEWTNHGLFHSCRDMKGSYGIYVDFNVTQEYPQNCVAITFHSYGDDDANF
ncbi:unnamed protein product [Rhizoctonia solani]|uniref:Uncharacterized protein n=1 Tax=Rhizoctonia solani TaxID=456999 RepID=A0A8H3BFT7_9AGAM|nr:hypothetical protein RHS04_03130 [Rhizoctonia solani]KAF8760385.1 hypothetical protein RHS01_01614 [Rhizoctonia solani]CAE6456095.1 unnamed protein product [Rhizoctonia solani]